MIPVQERRAKQKWMTNEILDLMTERRLNKRDVQEYNRIDKEIKTKCKLAKEQWLSDQCEEIEELEKHHQVQRLHNKVKQLTDRKSGLKTNSCCIRDKDGQLLFEREEIEKRWVEYISELYNDEKRGSPVQFNGGGPSITEEEVEFARRRMRDKKAAGVDGIDTECIKALDGISLRILTDLCNRVYKSGPIPVEMMNSVFITLPKKQKATDCTEFRTISLMSHVMKLLLRIILNRVDNKIEGEI